MRLFTAIGDGSVKYWKINGIVSFQNIENIVQPLFALKVHMSVIPGRIRVCSKYSPEEAIRL